MNPLSGTNRIIYIYPTPNLDVYAPKYKNIQKVLIFLLLNALEDTAVKFERILKVSE